MSVEEGLPTEKECIHCRKRKPLYEFPDTAKTKKHRSVDGKVNRCNECITNQRMKRQSNDVAVFLRDLVSKSKSHSTRRSKDWDITVEQVIELWNQQDGKCAISGVFMTHHLDRGDKKEFNASLDRIRSSEGYTFSNVQLVCQRVNYIKNDLDEASLYWWVKQIFHNTCD